MIIYVAYKMDSKIVKKIPSPKGCIGVLPVFDSLKNLANEMGENVKHRELEVSLGSDI